ncbi:MAG TPA: sigma-70 family RNA polymerase sigma factor [Steroidobacteraceae bacterium]|nr:sigma-70 family RNA polymerase sigma factor [Steroidobacteraceae bacterium]
MQTAGVRAAGKDQDVAELLQAGRIEHAFELLLPRYEAKIYRLCHALLRDRMQAEDAAQESLLRVWRSLHRYDGRAALSTWIYAITRNRCLTAMEHRRRGEWGGRNAADAHEELASLPAPSTGSDADGITAQQRDAQLRALVQALPERLRRVLLLYYFEERSVGEVASMLGCPEGTVKTQLFRARSVLAERLRVLGLDDPRAWLEVDK